MPPWYWHHHYPHYRRGRDHSPWYNDYQRRVPYATTSTPYGMDAYAGGGAWDEGGEYANESYLYPYDTSGYYMEMGLYPTSVPYYEADPVQYAYTPADIPPRATVVRPPRTSPAALIVPGAARTPLYGLITRADRSGERSSAVVAAR
jgi:hypothetical protein